MIRFVLLSEFSGTNLGLRTKLDKSDMEVLDKKTFIENVEAIVENVASTDDTAFVTLAANRAVVVISMKEYQELEETLYLLSQPKVMDNIQRSEEEIKVGKVKDWSLIKDKYKKYISSHGTKTSTNRNGREAA